MDFVALCRGFMKERTESQFRDLEAPIKVSVNNLLTTNDNNILIDNSLRKALLCVAPENNNYYPYSLHGKFFVLHLLTLQNIPV